VSRCLRSSLLSMEPKNARRSRERGAGAAEGRARRRSTRPEAFGGPAGGAAGLRLGPRRTKAERANPS